jgi:eukaryotic-like serine/threonine-protein kinase
MNGDQRGGAVPSSSGGPGPLTRLLLEVARAPAEEVSAAWKEELLPGTRVGRFEIRREIGRGGFGAVYEAFDPELGRDVALKALRPRRGGRPISPETIRLEAEAVAKLNHPNMVTLFDVGSCPAGPYLVMELLRGQTLADRLDQGALPLDEALRVADELARGLAHAHQHGVIHRDLKPANAYLCEDGGVKILDFGLAHLLGSEGSSEGGTPDFMAPEQARGEHSTSGPTSTRWGRCSTSCSPASCPGTRRESGGCRAGASRRRSRRRRPRRCGSWAGCWRGIPPSGWPTARRRTRR